jgi:protein O-mannosyl-transferase
MSAATPSERRPGRAARVAALLAIALAAFLTFRETLVFDFLVPSDDELHVTQNARLLPPSFSAAGWFWVHPYGGMYIPVSYDVWMAEAELAGGGASGAQLDAHVFRVGSLTLHIAAACCAFLLFRRWLGSDLQAFAGALVFELHPLQVESVAWISETRGLLAAVFGFAALWAHAGDRSRLRACVGCLLLALAMLSKPSAAAIPLIALVLDRMVLERGWRESLTRLAPWLATVTVLSLVAKRLQPDTILDAVAPWVQRPWIAADAAAFYLRKLALPLDLVPDHGRTPARVLAASPAPAIAAALLIAGLLLLRLPGRRWIRTALLIFLAGLAPVLGLVPFAHQEISTVASRFAYLALLGPALGFGRLAGWLQSKRAAAVLLVPIAACAVLSFRQARTWRDVRTAFERNLALQPASHQSHGLLGKLAVTQGDLEGAYEHFSSALRLGPDPHEAELELGNVRFRQGRLDEAAAHYRAALASAPGYLPAQRNLARVAILQEHWPEAEPLLERLHEHDASDTWITRQLARVVWRQGDPASAARLLDDASHADVDCALDRAWLLATSSDPRVRAPDRALSIAEGIGTLAAQKECERQWILAAAHAAAGESAPALQLARNASALAMQSGRAPLAQRLSEWIARVERGEVPSDLPPLPEAPPAPVRAGG